MEEMCGGEAIVREPRRKFLLEEVVVHATPILLFLLNRRNLTISDLELTDNCLESVHCRFTTPQWHAVDFGHCVQDHAAMFHSFTQIKLKTLILSIAQLTSQGGGGGNHKGDHGEELHGCSIGKVVCWSLLVCVG